MGQVKKVVEGNVRRQYGEVIMIVERLSGVRFEASKVFVGVGRGRDKNTVLVNWSRGKKQIINTSY